jgi:hypothetical protein
MVVLAIKILAVWSATALVIGLIVGAMIRAAERLRQDEFLTALFATLAGEHNIQ